LPELDKHLHIVSLDVPYPVDYGGVFDLFYKLPALQKAGIKIHLHCFDSGRGEQPELNKYCETVQYYPRNQGHKGFSNKLPYIVCSRSHAMLIDNLTQDNYPILFEGVHSTYHIDDERLANRKLILRLHNVESNYYAQLCKHERSLFKKLYFYNESRLLEKYERQLAGKLDILAVAPNDVDVYREKFHAARIEYLPIFLPYNDVQSKTGIGNYCLYHGNLSVAENETAVEWLLTKIFSRIKIPLVVAGKNPSSRLMRLAHQQCHTCIVANPGQQEMEDLIKKAQINIVPSFNETGIKLKLLDALYMGRHVVVNDAAIDGTGLEPACHSGTTDESFQRLVMQLFHQPFCDEEIKLRERLLLPHFNNDANARKLISLIW
jgi:glycosyltransferase involved in cell wall biosynthesis